MNSLAVAEAQERILLGVAEFDDHRLLVKSRAEQHIGWHILFFALFAAMFFI
jgi:hypothetical protein